MRSAAIAVAVIAGVLTACGATATHTGASTPTATAQSTTTALPTALPTPTPTPAFPDAHQLTLQMVDIPAGYSPHPTAIMTIDARTVVSEDLLSDGSLLAQLGYRSGAEYGWERTGSGALAVQNVVIIVRDASAAATLLQAINAHLTAKGASGRASATPIGDAAITYQGMHIAMVFWRRGPIVAGVEVTDASMTHAMSLARTLDGRFVTFAS